MDRYTRIRGGSSLWSDGTTASVVANSDFFGEAPQNSFWLKVGGFWKRCVGYIKVSGVWKSFIPKVKTGGGWV